MEMAKFLKAMLVAGVMAACVCGFAACSGGGTAGGGVAATVNGTEIAEDDVTVMVQNVRTQSSLEDEDSWGEFLVSNDMTPESVREQIIDSLVDQELIKEGAAELGISVDSTEVDTYVESMKANFDSDEAWQEALTQAGFSDEEYRESIESSLLQQAINQHFEDVAEVETSDVLEAAKTYAPYYDGAKRSSHILIGVDDNSDEKAMAKARKKAQKLLDQITAGEISFEDAVKENSTDTASAEEDGDVGWDVLNSFVTEYTDALENLDKGDISDPVDSQFGVHIIKVTDVYKAPDEVKSIKDLPKAFRDTVKDYAKSTKANSDYTAWLDGLRESADIQINDMPANVPYNIDLTKYQEEANSEEGSDESASAEGEEASDGNAEGEAAEGETTDDASGEGEADTASDASADAESADAESADAESADAESSEASAE